MEELEEGDLYFLDEDGYYVTKEIFRGRAELKKCQQCGNYLFVVYAEKYSYFKEAGVMMIMGIKPYGYECDFCNCGFIYEEENE